MPGSGVYRHPPNLRPTAHRLPASAGTRLYLQPFPPAQFNRPSVGEQSAALPVGTVNAVAGADQTLSLTIGQVENPFSFATLAQTAHQDAYVGRFVIEASLSAQTVAANTWTFAFQADEADANANAFLALSLYVWRPGSSSVVGYVYDSDTPLGGEWPLTRGPQIVTFTGASVVAANGDVLVLEVWQHAAQGVATSYALDFYYGGTQDIQDGVLTDAATYLETPQVLLLSTPSVGIGRTFYLLNSVANNRPSTGKKSVSLPFGTFSVTAAGTANEQRLMDVTPAGAQVSIAWNSLAQTARQDGYLSRWSSLPLAAQSLAAGVWTLGIAASESNTNANSFVCVSLYLWRAGAVAAYLFDSTAALGTEWALTEQGVVLTFNGNAFTILWGDLLVFEFWQTATQATAALQSNSLFYAGATDPAQAVAATTAASFLRAPQDLTFADWRPRAALLVAPPAVSLD